MNKFTLIYQLVTESKKFLWKKSITKIEGQVEEIEGANKTLRRYCKLKERKDILKDSIIIKYDGEKISEIELSNKATDETFRNVTDYALKVTSSINNNKSIIYGTKGVKVFSVQFKEDIEIIIYDSNIFIELMETDNGFNMCMKTFNIYVDIVGRCQYNGNLRRKLIQDCFSPVIEAGIIEVM